MSHPDLAAQFALCIRRSPNADLKLRKAYPVLPAAPNETGFLRIIDESGEDYLYPAEHFVFLDLPAAAQDALRHAAQPLHPEAQKCRV